MKVGDLVYAPVGLMEPEMRLGLILVQDKDYYWVRLCCGFLGWWRGTQLEVYSEPG